MRLPSNLASLLDDGFIEAVLRPLQSGKEALVFLVMHDGQERVAKVYKEAKDRNFKNRSVYAEGRGTRNTRDQRAMKRRSTHGRARDEEAWQSTEVDMIHRLRNASVRVPAPFMFMEGVLILELVQNADGGPAPRLGDIRVSAEQAIAIHDALLRDVVRMLCAGVVHGDLSEFNVLIDTEGPVIIDLPQAVDASSNPNARKLLLRDVENLQRFVTRWVPGRKRQSFAAEMWALYEKNELEPDTELTGVYTPPAGEADTDAVLSLIEDAKEDENWKRQTQRRNTPKHTRRQPHAPSKRRKKKPAPPVPTKPAPKSSLSDLIAKAKAPAPEPEKKTRSEPKQGDEVAPKKGRRTDRDDSGTRRRRRRRGERPASEQPTPASEGRDSRSSDRKEESRRPERATPTSGEGQDAPRSTRRRRRRRPEGDGPSKPQSAEREGRQRPPAKDDKRSERSPAPTKSGSARPTEKQAEKDAPPRRRRRRRRPPSGGSGSDKPPKPSS